MRVVLFVHSIISDWNHGNAHFLRGVATELVHRGCDLVVYEPLDGWSITKLVQYHGEQPLRAFHDYFPAINVMRYDPATIDLDIALDNADLVIVHEWNQHEMVRRIGEHRTRNTGYRLLFHDTHHRSVTDPAAMGSYDLSNYDGVLAFGDIIRQIYLERSWTQRAWTWHEAADVRLFRPLDFAESHGDLVWVGNWGDEERSAELKEFLFDPVKNLGLRCRTYGVRYPSEAHRVLSEAGIEYAGWVANFRVPQIFSRFRATVHIPRRPYIEKLRGIPTIRPFEALACAIPLICSPWYDTEGLFTEGEDYLVASSGRQMQDLLGTILNDSGFARSLATHGHKTVIARHTCAHRVEQLFDVCRELGARCVPQPSQVEIRQH